MRKYFNKSAALNVSIAGNAPDPNASKASGLPDKGTFGNIAETSRWLSPFVNRLVGDDFGEKYLDVARRYPIAASVGRSLPFTALPMQVMEGASDIGRGDTFKGFSRFALSPLLAYPSLTGTVAGLGYEAFVPAGSSHPAPNAPMVNPQPVSPGSIPFSPAPPRPLPPHPFHQQNPTFFDSNSSLPYTTGLSTANLNGVDVNMSKHAKAMTKSAVVTRLLKIGSGRSLLKSPFNIAAFSKSAIWPFSDKEEGPIPGQPVKPPKGDPKMMRREGVTDHAHDFANNYMQQHMDKFLQQHPDSADDPETHEKAFQDAYDTYARNNPDALKNERFKTLRGVGSREYRGVDTLAKKKNEESQARFGRGVQNIWEGSKKLYDTVTGTRDQIKGVAGKANQAVGGLAAGAGSLYNSLHSGMQAEKKRREEEAASHEFNQNVNHQQKLRDQELAEGRASAQQKAMQNQEDSRQNRIYGDMTSNAQNHHMLRQPYGGGRQQRLIDYYVRKDEDGELNDQDIQNLAPRARNAILASRKSRGVEAPKSAPPAQRFNESDNSYRNRARAFGMTDSEIDTEIDDRKNRMNRNFRTPDVRPSPLNRPTMQPGYGPQLPPGSPPSPNAPSPNAPPSSNDPGSNPSGQDASQSYSSNYPIPAPKPPQSLPASPPKSMAPPPSFAADQFSKGIQSGSGGSVQNASPESNQSPNPATSSPDTTPTPDSASDSNPTPNPYNLSTSPGFNLYANPRAGQPTPDSSSDFNPNPNPYTGGTSPGFNLYANPRAGGQRTPATPSAQTEGGGNSVNPSPASSPAAGDSFPAPEPRKPQSPNPAASTEDGDAPSSANPDPVSNTQPNPVPRNYNPGLGMYPGSKSNTQPQDTSPSPRVGLGMYPGPGTPSTSNTQPQSPPPPSPSPSSNGWFPRNSTPPATGGVGLSATRNPATQTTSGGGMPQNNR